MGNSARNLEPGTLWRKTVGATRRARSRGAVEPIPTEALMIEDGGVCFMVRTLSRLARKPTMASATAGQPNPFLPYEPALFVADISDTHLCLLNKFNVIENHLLIVTRSFEDQEQPLNLKDLEALWICLAEFDALAFYNGGAQAGASQRHKHLQQVPLPFLPTGPAVPIDTVLTRIRLGASLGHAPGLPFMHALAPVERGWVAEPQRAAAKSLRIYEAMLEAVGLSVKKPDPYNLLVTRSWMLLLPRSRESFRGVPVNALGFAGSLFARNEHELDTIRRLGPMSILREVGVAG